MDSKKLAIMSNFDTKMRVMEAMEALMAQTPLDKLPVAQICDAAGVSRATFYRCFKDKLAVAQWHLDYVHSLGTDKIGRTLSWQKGYYITEEAILENLSFYRNAALSRDYNALDNYAPRKRRETIVETLVGVRGHKLTEKLKIQVDAVVMLEMTLLPRWHYGDYDVSLDEISRWMADMVPKELFELLNTPLQQDGMQPRRLRPGR